MSVPDGTGFRLISKVIEKFRSPSTALMVYGELKEAVKFIFGINLGLYLFSKE